MRWRQTVTSNLSMFGCYARISPNTGGCGDIGLARARRADHTVMGHGWNCRPQIGLVRWPPGYYGSSLQHRHYCCLIGCAGGRRRACGRRGWPRASAAVRVTARWCRSASVAAWPKLRLIEMAEAIAAWVREGAEHPGRRAGGVSRGLGVHGGLVRPGAQAVAGAEEGADRQHGTAVSAVGRGRGAVAVEPPRR